MYGGVQSLHPAIHHLGKAGEVTDVKRLQPGGDQRLSGSTGRNQFNAEARQRAGEILEAGLIRNRQKGTQNATRMLDHGMSSLCHSQPPVTHVNGRPLVPPI